VRAAPLLPLCAQSIVCKSLGDAASWPRFTRHVTDKDTSENLIFWGIHLQPSDLGFLVVLGWHYTNTPGLRKDQVTVTLNGSAITLAATNAVLRLGNGDR
jgi:hypothetical protein